LFVIFIPSDGECYQGAGILSSRPANGPAA
jgi:hypothetical protein